MKKNKKGVIYSTNPNYQFEYENNNERKEFDTNQTLNIHLERYKGNKKAVVIKNFIGTKKSIEELAKMLKKECSVGGSIKEKKIIIQGDNREKIISLLNKKGYKTKKVGG
jgi:translation initiation factor 1